jgi:peptide-methionine (S)-S-oxide reductase
LTPRLLQTSYVATKLNGYIVGVGGSAQFLGEAETLGLTKEQTKYINKLVTENEGGALYC